MRYTWTIEHVILIIDNITHLTLNILGGGEVGGGRDLHLFFFFCVLLIRSFLYPTLKLYVNFPFIFHFDLVKKKLWVCSRYWYNLARWKIKIYKIAILRFFAWSLFGAKKCWKTWKRYFVYYSKNCQSSMVL